MNKIPQRHPPGQEADLGRGQLRNPADRHDQPGQGAELAPPARDRSASPAADADDPARLQVDPPRP